MTRHFKCELVRKKREKDKRSPRSYGDIFDLSYHPRGKSEHSTTSLPNILFDTQCLATSITNADTFCSSVAALKRAHLLFGLLIRIKIKILLLLLPKKQSSSDQ